MKDLLPVLGKLAALLLLIALAVGLLTTVRSTQESLTASRTPLAALTAPTSLPGVPITGPTQTPGPDALATLAAMETAAAILPPRIAIPTSLTPSALSTPWPTATMLPSVPPVARRGLWAENLRFSAPEPFGRGFKNEFHWLDWAPDGAGIAFNLAEGRFILDERGQIAWPVTSIAVADEAGSAVTRFGQGFHPHWSPDGRHIAYLAYLDTLDSVSVRVVNLQTKQETEVTIIMRGAEFTTLAWLSSWELAFYKQQPLVFDLRTGQSRPMLEPAILQQAQGSQALKYLASSPASTTAGVGSKAEILLLEWRNGSAALTRRIQRGLDHEAWSISPDGELVAYVDSITGRMNIAGVRNQLIQVELPSAGRGSARATSWSPDSRSLLFVDGEGGKVVNRDGSGLRAIPGIAGDFLTLEWSPRGNRVLAMRSDGELITVPVSSP